VAERLWSDCTETLRTQISDAVWKTWFEAARPLTLEGRCLVLAVPSLVAKQRIEGRYLPIMREALSEADGQPYEVVLEVHTHTSDESSPTQTAADSNGSESTVPPLATQEPPSLTASGKPSSSSSTYSTSSFNPHYTFEDFVIGTSNRFAHAAALSVAEAPARSYNPLFIYGAAGLGKTHLLHAIGHYVLQNYPGHHIRYVSTETFTNEFIDAIRTNTSSTFKRRYRECDVLLVDDIQFLENKEQTQEEFFHTFNSLHQAVRQIVITSDRSPKSMATLEDRLRSRFEWGLITDIQPPDLETRIAILRHKAARESIAVPNEVLEFIATHVTDNIRELEGALIRVTAFSSLNRQTLTHSLAERVLSDLFSATEPRQITPTLILDTTAKTFGFTVEELCGKSRRRPLVTARQIGMYVFREMTDFSYPAIAREFGGRDHTTVIHAVEKISTLMKERRAIYEQVTELIHRIKSGE
jgi:chromosomal replication initiator protein